MSDLTRQDERIVRNAQRAGLRMSRREGHAPTKEELLKLKVQVASAWSRWVSAILAMGSAGGSWYTFSLKMDGWGFVLAVLALLFFCFAIFGIRRTLSKVLDGLDVAHSAELFGLIMEGIFSAVGSLFD
ncbi:hypothetical protein [Verrucomicrobium sp. BvORR106]|uniref:hypothetical protein n=1 Tax=Verrucomicrobium sp. BvORR106 TaxID=1403819 RepID=UPI00056FA439|nr:hypothetical protein [Verrucomicrobium sp. BvORR106]